MDIERVSALLRTESLLIFWSSGKRLRMKRVGLRLAISPRDDFTEENFDLVDTGSSHGSLFWE